VGVGVGVGMGVVAGAGEAFLVFAAGFVPVVAIGVVGVAGVRTGGVGV